MIFVPAIPLSANNMKIWSPRNRKFFLSKKYAERKKSIAGMIAANWRRMPFSCPVQLILYFHLKNPAKHWDLDNHVKAVKDAMTGLIYEDDCQVADLTVCKLKTCGIEGFEFSAAPVEIKKTDNPHFEKTVKPQLRRITGKTNSTEPLSMTAEEFNRQYNIKKPTLFK